MMNPDPAGAWNVVLVIGLLANMALTLVTLARSGRTQKREVTLGEQFATRESLTAQHQSIAERVHKVETDAREVARESSESRARLYTHIDNVRKELSEKMDDLPAMVIATLKNTGAI